VAYRVLQYQTLGASLYSADNIGFNNLCTFCGLEGNPVKHKISFHNKAKADMHIKAGVMSEDFLLYSAWDVEPLHEIRASLDSLLAPDYLHLVHQLSELEVIRILDPQLFKLKRSSIKDMEDRTIFFSNMSPNVTKPSLYQEASRIEGHKHIYHSDADSTAHLVLPSRLAAVQAMERLSGRLANLGEFTAARTVTSVHPTEAQEVASLAKYGTDMPADGLVPTALGRELVAGLLRAEVPIVVDFPHCEADAVPVVELYAGTGSVFKLPVSGPMVAAGLGELMASDKVVKVLFRVDSPMAIQAVRTLHRLGVTVRNVFDVGTAAKFMDYGECGQSVYTASSKKLNKLLDKWSIATQPGDHGQHRCYLAYLHLADSLPAPLGRLLAEKTELELGIGLNEQVDNFKEKRVQLRVRMDGCSLHLRLRPRGAGRPPQLAGSKWMAAGRGAAEWRRWVEGELARAELPAAEWLELGRGRALLRLESRAVARQALELLAAQEDTAASAGGYRTRFVVSSPESLGTLAEKPTTSEADMEDLEDTRQEHIERLRAAGLTLVLQLDQDTDT
jgi:hypothetical protein